MKKIKHGENPYFVPPLALCFEVAVGIVGIINERLSESPSNLVNGKFDLNVLVPTPTLYPMSLVINKEGYLVTEFTSGSGIQAVYKVRQTDVSEYRVIQDIITDVCLETSEYVKVIALNGKSHCFAAFDISAKTNTVELLGQNNEVIASFDVN